MPRTTPGRIPGGSKALVTVMRGFIVAASSGLSLSHISNVYNVYSAHAQTCRCCRPADLGPTAAAATAAIAGPGGDRGRRDRPGRRGRAGRTDHEGGRRPAGPVHGHGAVPVRVQQGWARGPDARRGPRRDPPAGPAGT